MWWLVGSPAAAASVRAAIAGSRIDPGVMTLRHAAQRLLADAPLGLPLGPAAKRELIAELAHAARRRETLGPLEELIESPGLIDHLASRFRTLRRERVGAEEATGALRRSDGRRAGSVLARLYREYLAALERHRLLDEEGVVEAATRRVDESALRLDRLLIDLPLGGCPLERDFVRALDATAAETVVVRPGPVEDRDWGPSDPEAEPWLVEEGAAEPAPPRSAVPPAGLAAVRLRLFDDAAEPQADAAGVRVVAGGGAQDTARRVARRVKRLLVTGETRPNAVVLAVPRLDASGPRYAEALREYGVPAALDAAPRLRAAALVGLVTSLLELGDSDWAFGSLLAVLSRSDLPALAAPTGGADGFVTAGAAAEWFVRETQAPSGRRYVTRQAETLASRRDESEGLRRLGGAAAVAVGVFESLGGALDRLPSEATPLGWLDALDDTLRRLGHPGLFSGSDPADRAAGDALEEAAASIETLARWRRRSPRLLRLRGMLELIRGWSTRLRLPTRESPEGRVRIVGTAAAVGLDCEHLLVVDADESSFSAADAAGAAEAMRSFWELAATPTAGLTLAYAALDESAQPMAPSPYVTDVERLFVAGATRRDEAPPLAPIDTDSPPVSRREQRIAATARAAVGDGGALAAYGDVHLLDRLAAVHARATGDAFGPWEGVFDGKAAHAVLGERYGADHLWSASQLELMATCPYKFFARQVLRMEPVGELTLGVDYRRRGSLMHDALAECLAAIAAELGPGRTLRDVPREELSGRLAERIDTLADTGKLPPHKAALLAIEARQARDWAERYAEQQAKFDAQKRWSVLDRPLTPTLLEARFGPARHAEGAEDSASVDEPFELTLPGGEVLRLTGRIDRIDSTRVGDQTLFTVIDYKTSRDYKSTREAIESGKQLQPVLYALAAKRLFFGDDAVPVAAGYWAVQKKGFVAPSEKDLPLANYEDGRVAPSDEWAAVVETVRARCEQLVHDVRHGVFPMHNDDEHCGRLCEFRTVCRVGQARSLGKRPPDVEEGSP